MSLRPNNPKKIQVADLLPGDVLLSCGPNDNALDDLIKLIDQGDYSHTSIFIGIDAGNPMVVEATKEGIKYDNISVDLDAQVLVDAYRFVSSDGHSFGDPGWPVQPLIDKAMSFVGGNYSYSELMLGAIVVLSAEKSSSNRDFDALVRLAESLISNELEQFMQGVNAAGKVPMTCVEVATRAFWEATTSPAHACGLQVQMVRSVETVAMRNAAASSADAQKIEQWHSVRERVARAMSVGYPSLVAELKAEPGLKAARAGTNGGAARNSREQERTLARPASAVDSLILVAGSADLPAGMCTPRDLETSPSLKFFGCLKDSSGASSKSAGG